MAASAANSNSLARPLDDDAGVAAGGLLLTDVDVRCGLELLDSGVGLPDFGVLSLDSMELLFCLPCIEADDADCL